MEVVEILVNHCVAFAEFSDFADDGLLEVVDCVFYSS